jgi:hypothetical protein
MRFFRVNLPRKYLCEDHADELIQTACSMKVFFEKKTKKILDLFLSFIDKYEKIKTL